MFSFVLSRSSPVLDLAPKHAWAVALYVMGGRQRLLSVAYIPMCAQELSSLRHGVWDSQGWGGSTNKLTAQGSLYQI